MSDDDQVRPGASEDGAVSAPGDGGEEVVDQSIRDRRQAQGAAGDLARMGIDPRSLGLGEPEPARPAEPDRDDDDGDELRAPVVQLRPEFNAAQARVPKPAAPVPVEESPAPALSPQSFTGPTDRAPASRQAGRFLRTIARGVTTPDVAATVQGEREVLDAIRNRQTDRRIIAFLAGKGGVGCTTVAVGVGTALTALRDDRSVVVDVQQGTPSLGALFGVTEPMAVRSLAGEVEAANPPTAPSGLGLLDGSGWDSPLTRQDLLGTLDRLRSDHAFNLLDVGDDGAEAGHAAIARADQTVFVTTTGGLGIAALGSAIERVRLINPAAISRSVHVVVSMHEAPRREIAREFAAGIGVPIEAVVVVPSDPHLAPGHAYDPALVQPETRDALLRIAGLVALGGVRR